MDDHPKDGVSKNMNLELIVFKYVSAPIFMTKRPIYCNSVGKYNCSYSISCGHNYIFSDSTRILHPPAVRNTRSNGLLRVLKPIQELINKVVIEGFRESAGAVQQRGPNTSIELLPQQSSISSFQINMDEEAG